VLVGCACGQARAPEYYRLDKYDQLMVDILCFQLQESAPTAHHRMCEVEEAPVLLAEVPDRIPLKREGLYAWIGAESIATDVGFQSKQSPPERQCGINVLVTDGPAVDLIVPCFSKDQLTEMVAMFFSRGPS
jgi:hypothetical protein